MSEAPRVPGRWYTTPGSKTLTMRVGSGHPHFTLQIYPHFTAQTGETLSITSWAWHVYLCGKPVGSGTAPDPNEAKKVALRALKKCAAKLLEDSMNIEEDPTGEVNPLLEIP